MADTPKGVNKEVWEQATHAFEGKNGGRGMSDPKAKEAAIREVYDGMVSEDQKTKDWGAGSGILGDIGEKDGKEDTSKK